GGPAIGTGIDRPLRPPEQVVRPAAPAGHHLEVKTTGQLPGGFPELESGAELDRRDRHVHGVDEVGVEELPDRGDAATEPHVLAPPALPRVVLPRSPLRPELVAAHDLGADIVREVAGEVVVESAAAAGIGAIGPARGGARPSHQVAGVEAERAVEALVLPGGDAVARDAEV